MYVISSERTCDSDIDDSIKRAAGSRDYCTIQCELQCFDCSEDRARFHTSDEQLLITILDSYVELNVWISTKDPTTLASWDPLGH